MSKLSFKYRFFKLIIKLIGVKRYFNKSESEIISNARKRMKKTKIPVLSHNEINYGIKEFNGAKVVYITHKKPKKKPVYL